MKKINLLLVIFSFLILSSCENPLFIEASGLYTISFETYGGTKIQSYKTDILTSGPKTQKQGYDFVGWYTSSKFDEEVCFPLVLSENTTLYAKWKEQVKLYYVSFVTNGGTSVESFHCTEISKAPSSTKKGYVFEGWYLDRDFLNPVSFPYSPKKNCIFYAKWIEHSDVKYYVRHYKQDIELNTYKCFTTDELTGTYGELTQAEPKNIDGFHNIEFEQKIIDDEESTVIDIYYTPDSITVIFDANDGSGKTDSQTFYFGVSQQLKANHFSRQNYIFDGWIEKEAASSIQHSDQSYMSLCYPHGTVITLYAKWVCGITVTNNTISSMNLASLTENCIIKVTGTINQNSLITLATKIKAANCYITLDLSETTGLEAIASTSNSKSIFVSCTKLSSIILPSSLTTIGSYAFYNCSSLTSVVIPSSVKTIGSYAFQGTGLKEIVLNGVETIGNGAFYGCTSLYKVTMTNVTTINNSAFYSCSSLTSITIDAQNINYAAFGDCKTLTSVTFNKAVKKISYYAFYNCTALSSVTFLDTKDWYRGSSLMTVTNPATNAKNIKNTSNYSDWTKK